MARHTTPRYEETSIFTFRLNKELHEKLKEIARIESRSNNAQAELVIRRYIEQYEAKNGPVFPEK